jgi:hypothetical protein
VLGADLDDAADAEAARFTDAGRGAGGVGLMGDVGADAAAPLVEGGFSVVLDEDELGVVVLSEFALSSRSCLVMPGCLSCAAASGGGRGMLVVDTFGAIVFFVFVSCFCSLFLACSK